MKTTLSTTNIIILFIIVAIILILLYINRSRIFGHFDNSNYSEFKYEPNTLKDSSLDENGLLKNEFPKDGMYTSYWYNYAATEGRSKCFACDAEGKYKHGSNCIDCETKGGRPINNLLNRVLTR